MRQQFKPQPLEPGNMGVGPADARLPMVNSPNAPQGVQVNQLVTAGSQLNHKLEPSHPHQHCQHLNSAMNFTSFLAYITVQTNLVLLNHN